ncbi:SH3 domain-containing protein [Tunicatimonas pelagia]|uniref:SH3 domain-containing protein n=1 Tax=Tunicatimonas pelagia TaxID=931531 RepID=UPI00266568C6|nr:SH3 domain-containing protein [Tunicatimonas pelagia]WKN43521.1 SH3 domain-containing protein [Tunicatimonas pelagia]
MGQDDTKAFRDKLRENSSLAIINDADGYTNVRDGKSSQSNIIDKIYKNELFYFHPEAGENWLIVNKFWNVYGYVHRSRIQSIETLTTDSKISLIRDIFKKEQSFIKSRKAGEQTSEEWISHHEKKYDPILEITEELICQTKNEELLKLLLTNMKLDTGSADEAPMWALGAIYVCNPDWTIKQIKLTQSTSLKVELEFGFENVTYNQKPDNYEELKQMINEL